MGEELSYEAKILFERADRAIAKSREIAEQRRQIVTECERAGRRQELLFIFRGEIAKPK
jgi:hypothetical protein